MGNDAYCTGCGARLAPSYRFCAQCGRPAAAAEAPPVLPRPARPPAAPAPGEAETHRAAPPSPAAGTAPSPAAAPAPAPARAPGVVRLVPVRHDGRAGPAQPIGSGGLVCGRTEGQLVFADDLTVSPRHARFTPRGEGALLEDLGSLNGTFLRLRAPRPLAFGDELRLGRQLLRLEPMGKPADGPTRPWGSPDPGYRARLVQVVEGGGAGEVFPLTPGENALGREAGRVTFPHDRYVSARHARLDVLETSVVVVDLGSSNGTFIRITGPVPVAAGDQVLVGMQLIRVE